MKKFGLVLAAALVSGSVLAAGTGHWQSGFGQGNFEYFVTDAKQNRLYIACNDSEPATMTLTLNGKDYGHGADVGFNLIVDGKQIDAPYDAGSHVGSENFRYAWDAIRKAKTLQAKTDNGKVVSLPLTGAAKALPASKSKLFAC